MAYHITVAHSSAIPVFQQQTNTICSTVTRAMAYNISLSNHKLQHPAPQDKKVHWLCNASLTSRVSRCICHVHSVQRKTLKLGSCLGDSVFARVGSVLCCLLPVVTVSFFISHTMWISEFTPCQRTPCGSHQQTRVSQATSAKGPAHAR